MAEVAYIRLPAETAAELDRWIDETGLSKTELLVEFVRAGMSHAPASVVRVRELHRQLREERAEVPA